MLYETLNWDSVVLCPDFGTIGAMKSYMYVVLSHYIFFLIFKLYKIVLVLPNIQMNLPQVYMCSPSWTLLPPPSPYHPSGSSQCTSPKHPVNKTTTNSFHLLFCFPRILLPTPRPPDIPLLACLQVSNCHLSKDVFHNTQPFDIHTLGNSRIWIK